MWQTISTAIGERRSRPPKPRLVPESVTARSATMCRPKPFQCLNMSTATATGRRMKPSTGRNAAAARKLKWATHTFDDWTITKEPTTTKRVPENVPAPSANIRRKRRFRFMNTASMMKHGNMTIPSTGQECSCGERPECGKPYLRRLEVTKEATETKKVPESAAVRSVNMCRLKPSLQREPAAPDWGQQRYGAVDQPDAGLLRRRAGNAVLQAEKAAAGKIRLSNKQNRQKRLRAGFVQNPQPAPAQPVSFSRRNIPSMGL